MADCTPRISVIIAARDAEEFIDKTLESLFGQSGIEDFEVVVVDDGSTDGTAGLARAAASRDGRFRLIRMPGRGVSAARNSGFAEARGRFVLFLDADDLLTPKALSRMVASLERSGAVAVMGGIARISELGEPLPGADNRGLAPERGTLLPLLRKNFVVNGGALAIRADHVDRAGGFDEDLAYGEDWEFWCRLAEFGDFGVLEGETVLLYRQRAFGANFTRKGSAFARRVSCIEKVAERRSLQERLGPELGRALRSRRIDIFWSNVRSELQFGHKPRAILLAMGGLVVYPESLFKPRLALRLIRSLGR